jgi:colanic acid/amylovoran biosynthesis glycosyltransferase
MRCAGREQPGRKAAASPAVPRAAEKEALVSSKKIAYILLWFPKPSETFIFREIINLRKMGLPIKVVSLYGEWKKCLSAEMALNSNGNGVARLGIPHARRVPADVLYWWQRRPDVTQELLRTIPLRRWSSLEVGGENLWAFLCGFSLARQFEREDIRHIHAPWANGPATAAWVASRLTGIPFSFMARAGDIYPPDGALPEKMRDSAFVRTNPKANVDYLLGLSGVNRDKIHLTYDGYPLETYQDAPVAMTPPYRLLAMGRMVKVKGFPILLWAARLLADQGVDFHLTLAGAGYMGPYLWGLSRWLGLADRVSFPGFIPHDQVSPLFAAADIFVMPSIIASSSDRDGLPNVILEALLHRLPTVATDVAGIGEVIRNGETGLLVPQKDPEALAAAILHLTRDRQAALEMAARGQELVKEQFDPARCHGQVRQLFQRFGA